MKSNPTKSPAPKESTKQAVHYMKTLVDVARESFLILDSDLRVISANPIFYHDFQVTPAKTQNVLLYDLGNDQWDIPELRNLLDEILPEKKVVRDFEVTHKFETIGKKTMLLNASQIDSVQLIILAIEDITIRKGLEQEIAEHVKTLESKVKERTKELNERVDELEALNKTMVGRELRMVELKKEIENQKKTPQKSNGNHQNAL